jgi:hypothetical protein
MFVVKSPIEDMPDFADLPFIPSVPIGASYPMAYCCSELKKLLREVHSAVILSHSAIVVWLHTSTE